MSGAWQDFWTDWKKMLPQDLEDRLKQFEQSSNKDKREQAKVARSSLATLEQLEPKMKPLETLENDLWAKTGAKGSADTDTLINLYKTKAFANPKDQEIAKTLEQLHQLLEYKKLKLDTLRDLDFALLRNDSDELTFSKLVDLPTIRPSPPDGTFPFAKRLWAVVIGIDAYQQVNPLYGCVRDARTVRTYLTNFLRVPSDNILVVESTHPWDSRTPKAKTATRANILDALYTHLRDNDKIQKDDNIFIYYSGHGASYEPINVFDKPAGNANYIESICPVDRSIGESRRVMDISDRELNTIFSEIREKRGPNITVAFDCCYSGGGMKDGEGRTLGVAKSAPPLEYCGELLKIAAADSRRLPLNDRRPKPVTDPEWQPDETSFAGLAASTNYETSMEIGGRGVFTTALCAVLQSQLDKGITYEEVINNVQKVVQGQKPMAIGRKDSALWFQ